MTIVTAYEAERFDILSAQASCDNFSTFRHNMYPELVRGWWQDHIEHALDEFLTDYMDGLRPKLLLVAPPQHGKSRIVTDFIVYASGEVPDLKTVYTSYSEDLTIRANREVQRGVETQHFKDAYPSFQIATHGSHIDGQRFERSTSLIEFVEYDQAEARWRPSGGSFRNTTINGQINGHTLNLGVIDDPLKGRFEANSLLIRDKTWLWLTDDFMSRFSNDAAFLMMTTRWHVDDPAARFINAFPQTRVVSFPALAIKKEKHRNVGDPLFPEFKTKEFLLERRKLYSQASWESLYQGSPIIAGGGMFKIEKFKFIDAVDRRNVVMSVRYWDKAGTEDGGAYTAGVLMHKMRDNTFVIEHVVRGQWSAMRREQIIKQCALMDNKENYLVQVWVEQEPGSGGKESAESTIRNLAGYAVHADKVTGSKESRAEPYSAQLEAGNIYLLNGKGSNEWVRPFIDEHEPYPHGKFLDQVDAAAGAFNKLTVGMENYDFSYSFVGNMLQLQV